MGVASVLWSFPRGFMVAAALLLASCSSGGSHAVPGATANAPAAKTPTAQFRLTIPAKINVSRVKRVPQYVSSATLSGTLVVNGATSYVNLSSGSASCVPSSQGLSCVISAPAVIGSNTASLTLYDGSCTGVGPANGPCTGAPTGSPLSAASNFTFNVTEGQNNVTFPLILGGVVNTIVISLGTTSTAQGTPATVAVTVTAYDADSNIIVGPGGFSDAAGDTLTIDLTDSDVSGATSLSPTSITVPGTSAILTYTGGAATSATIGATVSGGTITGSITPATLTIASLATVSTFAGTGVGGPIVNGPVASATFGAPWGVALDSAGNLYVTDFSVQGVREISAGIVSSFAGSGTAGFVNGPVASAEFSSPVATAIDSAGNVYVADEANNAIRKIAGGVVSTLAGTGTAGYTNGAGSGATFNHPWGIAVDSTGNVYVADLYNSAIRMITPSGTVTTYAGNGGAGFANGPAVSASFSGPYGVAVDGAGNVYVADTGNNAIRKIAGGIVSTLAGTGTSGFTNGPGTTATFNTPSGIAVDSAGNVYVGDKGNNAIREITPAGVVSTLAGTGTAGYTDGSSAIATFNAPFGLAVDAAGNVYVGDENNRVIRKITP